MAVPDPGIEDSTYLLTKEIFKSFLKVPILLALVTEGSNEFHAATPVNLMNFIACEVLVRGVLN
jgi:hypothetical protein